MEKQHSLLIKCSVANQAQHLSRTLPILTFHKHWSHKVIVQRQGCDSSQCCACVFLPTWDKTPPLPPIVVYKCKPKSLVIAQTNHTQQGSGYPCQAFFLTTSFMFCVWGRADGDLAYPECFLFAEMIRIGCRDWIRKPRSLFLSLSLSLSLRAAPNCGWYAVRFRAAYCTQNQRFLRGKWKY